VPTVATTIHHMGGGGHWRRNLLLIINAIPAEEYMFAHGVTVTGNGGTFVQDRGEEKYED
jgi:hypothetical protein